jgi:anti-sigma B factor antagonist
MTLQLSLRDLPPPAVDVAAEGSADVLLVRVRGEVDIATHEELSTRLNTLDLTPYAAVHLHLDGLDFCDSTGVRQLLSFAERARSEGRSVELQGAGRQLARLLALVGPPSAA